MIGNKQLASRFAAAVAVATVVGASAFADSRPSNETRDRVRERTSVRREGAVDRSREGRSNDSRNSARSSEGRSPRSAGSSVDVRGNRESGGRIERDRTRDTSSAPSYNRGDSRNDSRSDRNRATIDRNRNNNRNDNNRNDNRGNRNDGSWRNNDSSRNRGTYDSRNRGTYDGRSRGTFRDSRYRNDGVRSRYGYRDPYRYSGRVRQVYPYGGGYRVWLTGCNYPFFIPSAYYHRDRFRLGVTIALGGYYNSRGFYDYYDYYDDYYDGGRYYDARTSRGELNGIVESVDYRRETFVVRNEATGSFVTVVMRDRGRDPVRAGDYVELGGDWTRSGLFEAYRVDIVDYERRR